MSTDQNITLDTTDDNISNEQGLITTDDGDCYSNITTSHNIEVIFGQVIFNQVGSYTLMKNNTISGISKQRHFVQNLCSTYSSKEY